MNVTEKKKDQITSVLIQVVCVILGLIIMAPVLYCIAAAFMKPTEILSSNPSLFPSGFYLDNFIQALKMTQIPRFLVNSLFVSLVCSVMRMMVASMAAYAFAFFEFKGKNILFYLVLGTMLIPGDATIVTNYMTVSGMGLVNNYLDPNGIFLFDLKTDHYFKSIGCQSFCDADEEVSFIWDNDYDEEKRINSYALTLFVQEEDNRYERFDEYHEQRAFSIDEVRCAIEESGMIFLSAIDKNGAPATKDTDRVYIIAREKGKTPLQNL